MTAFIARHHALMLLKSPQTWMTFAVLSAVFAYIFLRQLEGFISIQHQLALQDHPTGLTAYMSVRYLQPLTLCFTVIASVLAADLFSGDFRHHTFALWQSSPVSIHAMVLSRFMGVMCVLSLLIILALALLASLSVFVSVDYPIIASAGLGLWLLCASCAACGLLFSSLTRHPVIAILCSVGLMILLWLLGSVPIMDSPLHTLLIISPAVHLSSFFQGYLHSSDIAYFLLCTGLFLGLTMIRLDALRHTGR